MLVVRGFPSEEVDRIRGGGADENGQPVLTRIAQGLANPCRHCLGLIAERQEKLVLACRQILADDTIAYVHIRSKFNCFQCRVDRA